MYTLHQHEMNAERSVFNFWFNEAISDQQNIFRLKLINQLAPQYIAFTMLPSTSVPDFIHSKAEQDLQNISFFQIDTNKSKKTKNKVQSNQHAIFSSWLDKDEDQFLNFASQKQSPINGRKRSSDERNRISSHQKFRLHHSMTFHPKKIDLNTKIVQSFPRQHQMPKSRSLYAPSNQKSRPQFQKLLENRSLISQKKSKQLKVFKDKFFEQTHDKFTQLQTQPSCNFINYPVSTVVIRRRQFRKLDKCPFPSLAVRLK